MGLARRLCGQPSVAKYVSLLKNLSTSLGSEPSQIAGFAAAFSMRGVRALGGGLEFTTSRAGGVHERPSSRCLPATYIFQ